jgi:hypothetical protein
MTVASTETARPARARRTAPAEAPAPVATPEPVAALAAVVPQAVAPLAPVSDDPGPRPARRPFGVRRQKLAYDTRPGFHRHWFHDLPGRIPYALECGWKHVQDKDGRNVCLDVGARDGGGSMRDYLMELPLAWYNEDQAAKLQSRNDIDAEIRRGVAIGRNSNPISAGYATPSAPGFTDRKVSAVMQEDGKQFFGDRAPNPETTGAA